MQGLLEELLEFTGNGVMPMEEVAQNLGISKTKADIVYNSAIRKLLANPEVKKILQGVKHESL